MGNGSISRLRASSWLTGRPACAYPISLKTMPKPAGVSRPRFSESAICHISPRTSDDNRVFSKKVTALSPVTTPILSESARENRWPKTRRSSGERWRFGSGWVSLWELVIEKGEPSHTLLIRSRTVGHVGMMWSTRASRWLIQEIWY